MDVKYCRCGRNQKKELNNGKRTAANSFVYVVSLEDLIRSRCMFWFLLGYSDLIHSIVHIKSECPWLVVVDNTNFEFRNGFKK
jgi:hypothetical protein